MWLVQIEMDYNIKHTIATGSYHIRQHRFDICQNLIEIQVSGFVPGISDSQDLGWGPIICISSKFPGDADAPGLEPLVCINGFQAWLQIRNT